MIAPIVEQIHGELGDKVEVMKMDIDQNPATPMQLGIMSIPTVIIFKDGKAAERTVGLPAEHEGRPQGQAPSPYLGPPPAAYCCGVLFGGNTSPTAPTISWG